MGGELSKSGMEDVLLQTGGKFTEEQINSMYKEVFDNDGNNQIDFVEFILGISLLSQANTTTDKAKLVFKILDLDNSGKINKSEAKQVCISALKKTNKNLGEQEIALMIDQFFAALDDNKDGLISLDEFVHTANNNTEVQKFLNLVSTSALLQ